MADRKAEQVILLEDGIHAFPEILTCIHNAGKSLMINMFIWRNDAIGKRMAEAVLEAADRGVQVEIVKDRYGISCEYSEEDQTSFFHPAASLSEKITIRFLEWFYNRDLFGGEHYGETNPLREKIMNHPNIRVSCDTSRYDHSKFYIFDERILILGGINIEDKENGSDRAGRAYRDFMVRLEGEEFIKEFHNHRQGKPEEPMRYAVNLKEPVRMFEMKDRYAELIRNAKSDLTILMAYFSPVKEIMDELKAAADRGVSIRILIPSHANFTSDLNRKTVLELWKYGQKTNHPIRIYLSDDMTHTKLLMSDSLISVGSCNINKKAFDQLDECNYVQANDEGSFARQMRRRAEEIIAAAHPVAAEEDLSYHRLMAMAERIVM